MTDTANDGLARCVWATKDPLSAHYHDTEWGVPCYDDAELFERLLLEGFQAGLSWVLILRRREALTRAFAGWDADAIARFTEDDIARLLADPGIIRNQRKVRGAVRNARAYLDLRAEHGSFSEFVWSFVDGTPIVRRPASESEIPVSTPESLALSKELKRRGFTFVGPTIMYAFMQSVGMVDDHVVGCFRAQV